MRRKSFASRAARAWFLPNILLLCLGMFLPSCAAPVSALPQLTPTPFQRFAAVNIAKPAYTATPMPTPTTEPTLPPIVLEEVVSPIVTSGNKSILVDISEQSLYAYDSGTLIFNFTASTGMNNATATGSFEVLDKIPNAYGSTWDIWMPHWMGIYYSGGLENGIHALPVLSSGYTLWEGYLGVPVSYGCVVLGTEEARMLYDWADVGTPVDIQW